MRSITMLLVLAISISAAAPVKAGDPATTSDESSTAKLDALVSMQDEFQARELAYLKHQLDSLRLLVLRLVQNTQSSQSNDSVLACVADELAMLKFENQYLRTMLQASFAQYASTDEDDEVARPQVAALSRSITDLHDNLEDLLERREAPQVPADKSSSIEYCGWIDVSNSTEYNTNRSDFNLDQVELDVSTGVTERGSVRADLEYVPNGAGEFSLNLEQAFFKYALGARQDWSFTFGKFNSPTGWERADADGLYLYSYSLVYTYGLPTNLTGALVSWSPTHTVSSSIWLTNGWDVDADNNSDKTVGAQFSLTPVSTVTARLAALYGPEQDDNISSKRSTYDAALTWSPSETFTFGANVVLGNETHVLTDNGIASWSGAMGLAQVTVGSRVMLFGRFDYFNDRDGTRTGLPQECKAVALSPNLQVTDAFAAGVELRYDWSNRSVYTTSSGAVRRSQLSTALQFTYGI